MDGEISASLDYCVLYNCQTQAAASRLRITAIVATVESLCQARNLRWIDAYAIVFNRNHHTLLLRLKPYIYISTLRIVSDCIKDNIPQCHANISLIRADSNRIRYKCECMLFPAKRFSFEHNTIHNH